MQFKSIVASFTLLTAAVAALPNNLVTITVTDTVAQPVETVVSQCNSGSEVCCNVVGDASDSAVTSHAKLLDVGLDDIIGIVGLGCTNIGVVSVSNSACNEQAACCTGVQFNGLVNIGCSPINL